MNFSQLIRKLLQQPCVAANNVEAVSAMPAMPTSLIDVPPHIDFQSEKHSKIQSVVYPTNVGLH